MTVLPSIPARILDPFPTSGAASRDLIRPREEGARSEPYRLDRLTISLECRSKRSHSQKVDFFQFDDPKSAKTHRYDGSFAAFLTPQRPRRGLTPLKAPRSVPCIANASVTAMQNGHSDALACDLLRHYGPYVPLSVAWRWLSFSSAEAARCAWRRGKTPVPCVHLAHRRGLFLPVEPLAQWLQTEGLDRMEFLAPHPGRRASS